MPCLQTVIQHPVAPGRRGNPFATLRSVPKSGETLYVPPARRAISPMRCTIRRPSGCVIPGLRSTSKRTPLSGSSRQRLLNSRNGMRRRSGAKRLPLPAAAHGVLLRSSILTPRIWLLFFPGRPFRGSPGSTTMEIALSPLEFARRARRLYADREAVVDGDRRWTYSGFFDRCDLWSSALQSMGIRQGDRVAYIAPNTHSHLEAYYAIPQIGAVLVPINYRLTPDDLVYLINHSGARIVCAHSDYLDGLDRVRGQLGTVENFIALEGGADRPGWLDYESILAHSTAAFARPEIAERDLLTINYTSGTTANPKGVMITHRNAYMNSVGTLIHHHMTCADRYAWTLPMFHANGWTFAWTVTAAGGAPVFIPPGGRRRSFCSRRPEGATTPARRPPPWT